MKQFFAISLICLLIACSTSKQSIPILETLPKLTYQQMLEDHDTLVSNIKQTSPMIYFNKEVRGIDFTQHATSLRKQINPKTTTKQFLQIVNKTLFAAQDGHTGMLGPSGLDEMKKYGIPLGAVRGIDSTDAENSYKYYDYLKNEVYAKLDLNLNYTNGEYYNLLPFSYKGKNYPAAMKLISCNGIEIHQFVKSLTESASPLRWDRINNKTYKEDFYRYSEIYKNNKLKLVFQDKGFDEHKLNIVKNDTVTFLQKKNWKYAYNGPKDTVTTHYFEKQGIFYAKLPRMDVQLGDSINQRLGAVINKHKINAVVLDIRGNGGGYDQTYNNALKSIVKDTLRQNVVLGINWSPYTRTYYEYNRDSIQKEPLFTFKVDVPTLKEPEMFYIKITQAAVVPDSIKYPFEGKVYILQDRYIFSASSNLSNLAKNSEQLISIGETPDLLGGMQRSPFVMMLTNSKVIFRVEPQIDFTDNKTVADTFKNNVEYPIQYSIDNLYLRTTTKENVFGKEFLLNDDPMFKKVLELENSK
ncbi:S41 family peptidase [Flavobacterium xanthum]|uniref:Peptidase family S41 n=1 Tax=Flavobacterium xanthum TaxID=69322 RepID=A0A1M7LEN7_9FLAO|nr:S41 family peptidase [Flavobacterium xanthum]SHM76433.1 Peptidase family S41 [Flavobacterium xanthum]